MIKRLGHNVRLLEQTTSSTRSSHAAGMGTGPRGIDYFKLHDLVDQPYATHCPGFQILDKQAQILRSTPPSLNLTGWDVLYYRLRANFDGLRSEYCSQPPERLPSDGTTSYEPGKRAIAANYTDSLMSLEYEDVAKGGFGILHADLVVIADGANSIIRQSLIPGLKPTYAGYFVWRGLVPEKEVSESTKSLFGAKSNVFAMKRGYILGYIMPGEQGSMAEGKRYINYSWYYNCAKDSPEYTQSMTDTDGYMHTTTMPAGKMQAQVWENLQSHAAEVLNAPFLELVNKTRKPFISTVRDCATPQASFYDGRLLFVGEALTLYRPHTGISFNQSALDCLNLRKVLQGDMTMHEWEDEALWTQKTTRQTAIAYGEYYQSGPFSVKFLVNAIWFVAIMTGRKERDAIDTLLLKHTSSRHDLSQLLYDPTNLYTMSTVLRTTIEFGSTPITSSGKYARISVEKADGIDGHCALWSQAERNTERAPDDSRSVAVIGLSLKFSQEAISPDSFWEMLMNKRCTMTGVPKDRYDSQSFYHPDAERLDSIPTRGGHFIQESIAAFDAPFFSISAAEAAGMDPQQRGLLETTYHALENDADQHIPAGQSLESLQGSRTAVYTGCFTDDYKMMHCKDPELGSSYGAVGLEFSMLANRISWFFGLTGASLNVDTACSSSLVALDVACQSLRNGDSDMAIVAGCNLTFGPDLTMLLGNMSFLSHDSRCFAFDHRANGYTRGEGFGAVILKRASRALEHGDTIRAIVRSTGSNQDGYTPGITQPSGDSQARLIRETYAKAGLSMEATRFCEAHGTGTAIGDPTEASALGAAFRGSRSMEDPLYILFSGAVKSNIGHLEGASGVAGLIKTILILERAVIPPNANFERLNPRIDAQLLNIKFPLDPTPWPTPGLRRASVNSFGYGGTNAHVVIDDAANYLKDRNLVGSHRTLLIPPKKCGMHGSNTGPDKFPVQFGSCIMPQTPRLLVWSSADKEGLKRMAEVYSQYWVFARDTGQDEPSYLNDLAYTLSTRRSNLAWRSFVVTDSLSDLLSLESHLSPPMHSIGSQRLAFLFTGQGAQWPGMGRELLSYATFSASLHNAEAYFHELGAEWSLRDEVNRVSEISRLVSPELSQPVCTALQVALVDLLRALQVSPSAVIGHSSGEIGAAYCIGAISSRSAWKIAYYRGLLAEKLMTESAHKKGGMMAVGLSKDAILPYLRQTAQQMGSDGLVIACINSLKNVTISGDLDQIDALHTELERQSIFAQKLHVSMAYHSPHMDLISNQYLETIGHLERGKPLAEPAIMISTVSGEIITTEQLLRKEYWVRNMVCPVNFEGALRKICGDSRKPPRKKLDLSHRNNVKMNDLLEIGPHAGLRGPIRDCLSSLDKAQAVRYDSVLIRHQPADETFLKAMGRLHCCGYPLDISKANHASSGRLCNLPDLPHYPFNHSQSYWHENRASQMYRFHMKPKLDLLGKMVTNWNPLQAEWRHFLRVSEQDWIGDHKVNGCLLFPATGMLVMAIEAAKQVTESDQDVAAFELKNIVFHTALRISSVSEGAEVHLHLFSQGSSQAGSSGWSDFRVYYRENEQWIETCRGSIKAIPPLNDNCINSKCSDFGMQHQRQILRTLETQYAKDVDAESMYQSFREGGNEYGPTFQRLEDIKIGDNGVAKATTTLFRWHTHQYPQAHVIHPTSFDALSQLVLASLRENKSGAIPARVVNRIQRLWISSAGLSYPDASAVHAAASSVAKSDRLAECTVSVTDVQGAHLRLLMEGLHLARVSSQEPECVVIDGPEQLCYQIEYKPDLNLLGIQTQETVLKTCRLGRPEPVNFYNDLSLVILSFMVPVLEGMTQQQRTHLPPHLSRYIEWLQLQYDSFCSGELPHTSDSWHQHLRNSQHMETMSSQLEKINSQGKLYVAVGQMLPKVISGEVDPLDLLFRTDILRDAYREINNDINCLPTLEKYLDLLSHNVPGMKVIELGAGTGGATKPILESLQAPGGTDNPRFRRYDFTDISESFFESAKASFSEYKRVNYFRCDIEQDPAEQNIEAGSYDLVIAANAGGPVGRLYAIMYIGLITELGTDDYRRWGPCLTTEKWHEVLAENGFLGTDIVFRDYEDETCHEQSVMVATAAPAASSQRPHTINLLVDSGSEFQQSVANHIQELMHQDDMVVCKKCPLAPTAAEIPQPETIYVFLQELERPLLTSLDHSTFVMIQRILTSSKGVLWVTKANSTACKHPDFALIDGLSRAVRAEHDRLVFITAALNISSNSTSDLAGSVSKIIQCTDFQSSENNHEVEYLEMDGILQIGRLVESSQLSSKINRQALPSSSGAQALHAVPPVELRIRSLGLLDSFYFAPDETVDRSLAADEVEIRVQAVGLNFKDCLVALGKVPEDTLGNECAGIITRVGEGSHLAAGDRVCAATKGCFKSFARAKTDFVWKIPNDFDLCEAAALPATLVTAYIAIHYIAKMEYRESILIHAGAGGTGQAAIQIARRLHADIFVTVGTVEKKRWLIEEYGIPEDHIFYSRDTSFASGIRQMRKTGIDIVLNSLAGESLVASWECIAPFGRFIELGKQDIHSDSSLPMSSFERNVSFHALDVSLWMDKKPKVVRRAMEQILHLVSDGELHAARPLHTYSISDVESAFRHLQTGDNVGKLVIKMEATAVVKVSVYINLVDVLGLIFQVTLPTKPSFTFTDENTYVIAGGLGGLGRSIASWMAERGARHLILLSRHGPRTAVREFLTNLKSQGVNVATPACDITDKTAIRRTLDECMLTMPRIKGCIQASMVLKVSLKQIETNEHNTLTELSQDSIFESMSYEDWKASVDPKVTGSWNLHEMLPNDLNFFVLLSSVAGIAGLRGQSNYAAGNTFQDALARYRTSRGQKAIALDLGAMVSEGLLAEDTTLRDRVLASGNLVPITQNVFFALLDHFCNPSLEVDMLSECQSVVGINSPANIRAQGFEEESWLDRPLFRRLWQLDSTLEPSSTTGQSQQTKDFKKEFVGASALPEAGAVVTEALVAKLSKSLTALAGGEVDLNRPMLSYGIDSLLAVELRSWFRKEFGADVPIFEIMGGTSFAAIGRVVTQKSTLRQSQGE
ncbi:MAG: hypothetical protein Q9188_005223 [Gyalolechia gomerana]